MDVNDDEPEDVKRALPVEKEIKKGEKDDTFEGYPRIERKKERWQHCAKPTAKKKAKSMAEGECCETRKDKMAAEQSKHITVMVFGKPCVLPKVDIVPRHCLSKQEYIDMLATPSRRCPPDCIQEAVIKKLKPVSQRIKELARPNRQRMLMTLQDGASRLKPEFIDNLIKALEGETCLTPEQAAKAFRDRKRKKIRKKREAPRKFGRTIRKAKKPGVTSGTTLDKDAVMCQYLMAERFVKSILDWKCPIPKEEYQDIARVIIRRLSFVLEYRLVDESDRKSQQMRFLSDVIACWIAGVLFEVAEDQRKELEEICERKRKEAKEEEEEEEEEDESDDDTWRRKRDRDEFYGEEDEDERGKGKKVDKKKKKKKEEEKGKKKRAGKGVREDEDIAVEDDEGIEKLEGEEEEEEARLQREKEEEEARLQKEREEEEARLQKEREEEEARLQKEREEEEARIQKEKEEEEARLQREKEEEARLQKEKEEEEARLQKEREEEEARLQKEREEEEARIQKEKEEEEARLQQEREEEEARIQKEREEEEARLQKEREEEEARLQKEKEEEEARLQKEKEEEEARIQKEKEEEEARLQKEAEEEAARLQKEKEEEEAARLRKEAEEEAAKLEKEAEEVAEDKLEEEEKKKEQALLEEEAEEEEEGKREKSILTIGDYGDLFETDLPFVTFGKLIDVLYAMLETMPEAKGVDLVRDRIQRAIYEKISTLIEVEDPGALDEHMKDVLVVLAGKIANWLKNILSESQVMFLDKYPAQVESAEIREWSKWLADVSDTATDWASWLRRVVEEAEGIRDEGITRGSWQDWTKSVDGDALLWRRFHLQTIHQAHRNVTLMAQRQLVKTGSKTMELEEKEIRNTNLQSVTS